MGRQQSTKTGRILLVGLAIVMVIAVSLLIVFRERTIDELLSMPSDTITNVSMMQRDIEQNGSTIVAQRHSHEDDSLIAPVVELLLQYRYRWILLPLCSNADVVHLFESSRCK